MQIVIDISEDLYKATVNGMDANEIWDLRLAVKNGTPLPKGHGRLLDEKEILASEDHDGCYYDLVDMPGYIAGVPAVIEADKEESEEQA